MSRTIWKFQADALRTPFTLPIPTTAQVLTVQMQMGDPQIWILLDSSHVIDEGRRFIIYGTGHPIEYDNLHYIGTFQMANGALVWHLFEIL